MNNAEIMFKKNGKKAAAKSFKIIKNAAIILIVYGIAFTLIYPFLFMFVSSFRAQEDLVNPAITWITQNFTFEHIKYVYKYIDYPSLLGYTLLIAVGSAVFQMVVCGVVGYGFARFDFKGKGILFTLAIFTFIVPVQTYITPLYLSMRFFEVPVISNILNLIRPNLGTLNLLDNPAAFWVQSLFGMGIRSGLFIFIFRQFYRGMPLELENAALIDGCGPYKAYLKVMLPNAVMPMVLVFIFSLIWHWNDFSLSSIMSVNRQTVSVALAELRNTMYHAMQGEEINTLVLQVRTQAGALISVIPMLVLLIISQRFFTESTERSGIVG